MALFSDWYKGLTAEQRESFAQRAGTTTRYIETHLVAPVGRRKIPRRELMNAMIAAAEGALSFPELAAYFYGQTAAGAGKGCAA